MANNFLINGISLCDDISVGVHRYARGLIEEIGSRKDIAEHFTVAIPQGREIAGLGFIRSIQIGQSVNTKIDREKWVQLTLPDYASRHQLFGIDWTLGLPKWEKGYVSIDDCTYEDFPQDNPGIKGGLSRKYYIWRIKRIAKTEDIKIMTLSEYTKKEIARRYKIPEKRIVTVPCGWEHIAKIKEDESVLSELGIERHGYYFALGSRYPHKNIKWIVESAKLNKKEPYIITGTDSFLRADSSKNEIPSNIIFTGYLSDARVKALLKNAKALIQPSFSEGFGLPPLEALALGTPAIVSKSSCFPEIYGSSVGYIDPYIPEGDLNKLIVNDKDARDKVLSKYTWANSARSMFDLLFTDDQS